jgi:signal transduction histidine kinase
MGDGHGRVDRMTGNRWWHVLFGVTMLFLAAIAARSERFDGPNALGVYTCLGLLVIAYATLGRRALNDRRFTTSFAVILIILSALSVSFNPSMATIQAIAFPLIWFTIDDTRRAIVGNVVLALAVGAGFLVSLGTDAEVIREAVTIESVSLVGSLALGLWFTRVATLSIERQRLIDELTATQDQIALLHRDAGITSERERLAREIHDTVAQSLTGMVMLAQQARRNLDSGDLDAIGDELATLESSARDALVETRSLVAAGAPVELGAGVTAALERVAARFTRDTGIAVRVAVDLQMGVEGGSVDDAAPLARDVEVVLLRSAQEGLTNVRKHASASDVTLDLRASDGDVCLTVHDNGSGFDPAAPSDGFGLPGMRDRVTLAGGSLTITTAPGEGTTLVVTLPVRAPASSIPEGSQR